MRRSGHPKPHAPALIKEAVIFQALRDRGELGMDEISDASGFSRDIVRHIVALLERQGRIAARLETIEEAQRRVKLLPKCDFIRRNARRRLVYRAVLLSERAA